MSIIFISIDHSYKIVLWTRFILSTAVLCSCMCHCSSLFYSILSHYYHVFILTKMISTAASMIRHRTASVFILSHASSSHAVGAGSTTTFFLALFLIAPPTAPATTRGVKWNGLRPSFVPEPLPVPVPVPAVAPTAAPALTPDPAPDPWGSLAPLPPGPGGPRGLLGPCPRPPLFPLSNSGRWGRTTWRTSLSVFKCSELKGLEGVWVLYVYMYVVCKWVYV